MFKLTAGLLSLVLLGAAQNPTVTPRSARQALMAAEDGRLDLPDTLRTPAIELIRTRMAEDLRVVLLFAKSSDGEIQRRAIRTLGRYERRELTGEILQYLANGPREEVAFALAQSLRGAPLATDTSGEQVRVVQEALIVQGDRDPFAAGIGAIARAVARLPYVDASQIVSADAFIARLMARTGDARLRGAIPDLAAAAESLARIHGRTQPLGAENVDWLLRMLKSTHVVYDRPVRIAAMEALVAARRLDEEAVRIAASAAGADLAPLRRMAAASLGGAAVTVAPEERTDHLIRLLGDPEAPVRIEAVRAWVRQETPRLGCQRVLERTSDASVAVAVVAIDLLGDACRAEAEVTDRLAVLARAPGAANWHRESHALVALAKRAPEKVAIAMPAHLRHSVWQVRQYAARAAAIVNNVPVLERLAVDPDDNVREATLAPLRRLKGNDAEPHFLAALERRDYHLLRTAAVEMKGMPSSPALAGAIGDALKRATAEQSETSRDARLALLERLAELGDENQAPVLAPLLRDFDIPVSTAAADILTRWTGKPNEADPQLLPRLPVPSDAELAEAGQVTLTMRIEGENEEFEIKLLPREAPITSARFLRLVKAGYYDGLTFHRVVPNFVIQGGSPGANEYVGHPRYARDEIAPLTHAAGTVGLSTRGRDTGDMQLFVNVVHNPRLDYEYTVFGAVTKGDLTTLSEGARIKAIAVKKDAEKDDTRRNP